MCSSPLNASAANEVKRQAKIKSKTLTPYCETSIDVTSAAPPRFKGNSDPFDAYAIAVSPSVNRTLSFVCHLWLPANYITGSNNPKSIFRYFTAQIDWQDSISVFGRSTRPLLCSLCTQIFSEPFSPDRKLHLKPLCWKFRSLATLRSTLLPGAATLNEISVEVSIIFLFAAAISDDDLAEARAHSTPLKRTFENQESVRLGSREHTFLLRALRFDVQLAIAGSKAKIFDVHPHASRLL